MGAFRYCLRAAAAVLAIAVLTCTTASALTISGHVRNLESTGVGGIAISGTGGLSTFTAPDGSYSLTVSSGYSGTISTSSTSYLGFPVSYTYTNVLTNQINQDYAATLKLFTVPTCNFYNTAHTTSVFDMNRGAVAWGDYDGDGIMDAAIAGSAATSNGGTASPLGRVFHKDGSGVGWANFTEFYTLAGLQDAAAAWTDYDCDGRIDLLVSGDTGSSYVTKLYRNTGTSFSEVTTGLPGVCKGCLAWGDYNNDGKPDLLIAGLTSPPSTRLAKLYRNAGGGTFSEVAMSVPPLSDSAAAWGDYDNDGSMDFAISGNTGTGYVTKIYHNNGNGTFTDIAAGLTGVASGSMAWGDYDNDGKLDLAFCGVTVGGSKITRLCHNNGSTFTELDMGIAGCQGQLAWGDYDNDGKLDLAIVGDQGNASGGSVPKVYHNNGVGANFTGSMVDTTPLTNASVAWADHNGDGKLDLLIAGYETTNSRPGTSLYENSGATANTRPNAPTALTASSTPNSITLSWAATTDGQTPQAGLTYNIRVGTSPGAGDVVSGMADYSTGVRRLPAMGNVQRDLTWTVQGLTPRTYYWSVQAIDGAFAGSAWAAEKSIVVSATDAIPPVINSVTCSPSVAAPFDPITVTVDATDNVGVTSVTANGTSLIHGTGNTWTGTISATTAIGAQSVSIVSRDAAGNQATASGPYTTRKAYALTNRAVYNTILTSAFPNFFFTTCGRVTRADSTSFDLDDGSGNPVRVLATGHGLYAGNYAWARGTIDPTVSPRTLTARVVRKVL